MYMTLSSFMFSTGHESGRFVPCKALYSDKKFSFAFSSSLNRSTKTESLYFLFAVLMAVPLYSNFFKLVLTYCLPSLIPSHKSSAFLYNQNISYSPHLCKRLTADSCPNIKDCALGRGGWCCGDTGGGGASQHKTIVQAKRRECNACVIFVKISHIFSKRQANVPAQL